MTHKGSCHCGQITFEVEGTFGGGFGDSKGAEMAAINVRCLEGIELESIKRQFVDGRLL